MQLFIPASPDISDIKKCNHMFLPQIPFIHAFIGLAPLLWPKRLSHLNSQWYLYKNLTFQEILEIASRDRA